MGPVRAQRCPVRLPALRSRASAPHVLSLRRQTHPAAFLGRFSPLLEAEYISDVADYPANLCPLFGRAEFAGFERIPLNRSGERFEAVSRRAPPA